MKSYFKNIKIRQHYKYDCGAACIASVAAYYGLKVSLAQIRLQCGCTPDGISLNGLIEGAASVGLLAKGYKSQEKKMEDIRGISSPIIALIIDKENFYHYVTIYKTGKKRITIMDPAEGSLKRVKHNEFIDRWSGYIVIAVPQSNFCNTERAFSSLACLSDLIFSNSKDIALSFAGSVACSTAGVCISLLLQHLIDKMIPAGELQGVSGISILLLILMAITVYISYSATKYLIRSSLKIDTSLVVSFMEKLTTLPLSFYGNYQGGDIASRVEDISNIRSFVTEGIVGILTSFVTLAGALCVMFIYNPKLTLYILAFIPLYLGLYQLSGYINRRYSRELASSQASFQSSLLESIGGITNTRHYNAFPLSFGRVEEDYVLYAKKLNACADIVNLFNSSVQGVSKLLIFVIISVGSISLLNGEMSIGEFVGFYTLCTLFTVPLNELIATSEIISRTRVSVERIYEILGLEGESQLEEKIGLEGITGDLCIKGVGFKFPGRAPLFNGLSFIIKKGEITALKGESGCGKSTIAQLILRDYPITDGTITYADMDIGHFGLKQWREHIGYVPQRGHLFRASILDNITLKEENPNIEKLMEILCRLGMIPMVERFPKGLLTPVGEGGKELSGGECQKICIARALYKNPDIFIFDEVTSSLDSQSEKYVLEAICQLKREGKTILLISHKKGNLDIADNVVNIN